MPALRAQLPPLQPEQDCISALPVCQGVFVQPNSYVGEGALPNEINPGPSCLNSGERNDTWYIFTVQTSGVLDFTITPVTITNDYDWAVYDLSTANCEDIFGTPSLEISCNYSGAAGPTGPNGNPGSQNNPPIPVTAGQTLVLNVSNFTGSTTGYTLDFTASTATIFDNSPPLIDTLTADCSGQVTLAFTENVLCNSVQPSDFTVTDLLGNPYFINSVTGAACQAGGSFENEFVINVTPPFINGQYVLTVVGSIEDNCGNIVPIGSTDTVTISLPVIQITASSDSVCAGSAVTVSVAPQPGFSYGWAVNGVPAGTGISFSPVLNTSATISVGALAPNGCLYNGSTSVTAVPVPTASFTPSQLQICPETPLTLTYTGDSLPGASFVWQLSGGQLISGAHAGPLDVAWQSSGTKTLLLTVFQYGCQSPPFLTQVEVFPLPSATFSLPASLCPAAPGDFTATGLNTPAATYLWTFGSGQVQSGSGSGPYSVAWDTAGPQEVCLTVIDNGCVSPPVCDTVEILPAPAARIDGISNQCLKGNSYTFAHTGGGQILNYAWNLGEPFAVSNLPAPTYSYASAGPKTVYLTIVDSEGCLNTDSARFELYPDPVADFEAAPVCAGRTTQFIDLTVSSLDDPLISWDWSFGDSGTSPEASPAYRYEAWGNYIATLRVESERGCRDTAARIVRVYDQPAAGFQADAACFGVPVQFAQQSRYLDSAVVFSWQFGDGNTGSQAAPAYAYAAAGDYPVTLILRNANGCADTASGLATVHPLPRALFRGDPVCHDQTTRLDNLSFVDAPGQIVRSRWDLGVPGSLFPTSTSMTLKYPKPGAYAVELWVETQHGCADSLTREVRVHANPVADFAFDPVCEGQETPFFNRSFIDSQPLGDQIDSWSWDFGDGFTTAGGRVDAPLHVYVQAGQYQASITAVSAFGCANTKTRTVDALRTPALPAITGDTVCFGTQAFLLAAAPPPVVQVDWYESLSAAAPFHTGFTWVTPPLTSSGTYYVESVSAPGCRSARAPVEARLFADGAPVLQQSSTLVDLPAGEVAFSVGGNFRPEQYLWSFGDGGSSSEPAPVHVYQTPGKYEIRVQLLSEDGCPAELVSQMEVRQVVSLFIPSAFTPNGDGYNDAFTIAGNLLQQLHVQVYNRWGQVVFETRDPGFSWGGEVRSGGMAEEGVYLVVVRATDIQGQALETSGTLTILK